MSPPERVNVGCGPKLQLPGWWNTDIREFDGIDQVMDAAAPWPFAPRSLSYVYGEHFLEHLDVLDALRFLRFAGESLRIGGRLRLSTPNLEWVIATHFRLDSTPDEQRWRDTISTNRAFYGWGHRFLWSRELLEFVVLRAGYASVAFPAYGESTDPELRSLEQHGGYSIAAGRPSVIIVEATRQSARMGVDSEITDWLQHDFGRHVSAGH